MLLQHGALQVVPKWPALTLPTPAYLLFVCPQTIILIPLLALLLGRKLLSLSAHVLLHSVLQRWRVCFAPRSFCSPCLCPSLIHAVRSTLRSLIRP